MDEKKLFAAYRIGVLVLLSALVILQWQNHATLRGIEASLGEVDVHITNTDQIPVGGKVKE